MPKKKTKLKINPLPNILDESKPNLKVMLKQDQHPDQGLLKINKPCPNCGGMKAFHTDHVEGGFEMCKTCLGKGYVPSLLSKGEFLKMIDEGAVRYKKSGILKSIERSRHMNKFRAYASYDEDLADAILVDFINFLGLFQGLDYAIYTKDLSWENTREVCMYRENALDCIHPKVDSICKKKGCPIWQDPP